MTVTRDGVCLAGLDTETDYPYDGIDEKCSLKSNPAAYINSSVAISQDEAQMAAWLAKNGPISIGINANAMQVKYQPLNMSAGICLTSVF